MKVDGQPMRTIWTGASGSVHILDQTRLPHAAVTCELRTLDDAASAIRDMWVRGAPLIGVAAAYGLALALRADATDAGLASACAVLAKTRPTAINLRWALNAVSTRLAEVPPEARADAAFTMAGEMAEADVAANAALGRHGATLIAAIARRKGAGEPVNILTHCNAGWLAAVDRGTATAPIYAAVADGVKVHVWVDETRPRNQGAALTAWELGHEGIDHTLVVDNTGGHLMQHGLVDLVIVGTDRTTATGDVCNKIGTYLKALAAHDNGVPFWVAAPSSSIDFSLGDGVRDIPIERRSPDEVIWTTGETADGRMESVRGTPASTPAANYAFDVTPARLVTGLVTERGNVAATREALAGLFPDRVV